MRQHSGSSMPGTARPLSSGVRRTMPPRTGRASAEATARPVGPDFGSFCEARAADGVRSSHGGSDGSQKREALSNELGVKERDQRERSGSKW